MLSYKSFLQWVLRPWLLYFWSQGIRLNKWWAIILIQRGEHCAKEHRAGASSCVIPGQYTIDGNLTTEHVRVLTNIICTSRQLTFEVTRSNVFKIGMNTRSNKFYHLNKLIRLDNLNLGFVHFKKLMKLQFLKFGKTSFP